MALDSDVESHTTDAQSNGTQQQESGENNTESTNYVKTPNHEIVEAQGWVMDANGDVFLVAQPPTAMPHSSWLVPTACSQEPDSSV